MNIKAHKFDAGFVTLIPETIDDLYILYNVILPSDKVKAKTLRRIRLESEEGKTDKGDRVPMILTLDVEEVKFHEFVDRLRIKGKIIEGPEDQIAYGTYHTINVEVGTLLTLYKEFWSKYDISRIEEAVKKSSAAKALIITIEDGEATIAAVGTFTSSIINYMKERIPKKSVGKEKIRTEMIMKFFANVTFAIEETIITKVPEINAIILAGPGFTKDHYYRFLKEQKGQGKIPIEKIILESASNGGPSAIGEIIAKNIIGKIVDVEQANSEAKYLEEVMSRIGKNLSTVAYGKEAIQKAIEYGAVESLLIVDNALRIRDKEERKKVDLMLKTIQDMGGKIIFMSENHESGKQVEKFGGKIALLRFPIL